MADALFNEEFLQKIELLHVISKKVFAGSQQATRRAKRLGSGIEVRDFRPYVAGDDLRHTQHQGAVEHPAQHLHVGHAGIALEPHRVRGAAPGQRQRQLVLAGDGEVV